MYAIRSYYAIRLRLKARFLEMDGSLIYLKKLGVSCDPEFLMILLSIHGVQAEE